MQKVTLFVTFSFVLFYAILFYFLKYPANEISSFYKGTEANPTFPIYKKVNLNEIVFTGNTTTVNKQYFYNKIKVNEKYANDSDCLRDLSAKNLSCKFYYC